MEESPKYDWAEETLEELNSHDTAYWHSRSPEERLHALELMRQKTYGYDPNTVKLKKVIEIIRVKKR
ncbi:MAG TPA: hypothetical protein VIW64_11740 [Pyrinomonadaceae bacterium]|jgi:hypothetical protein